MIHTQYNDPQNRIAIYCWILHVFVFCGVAISITAIISIIHYNTGLLYSAIVFVNVRLFSRLLFFLHDDSFIVILTLIITISNLYIHIGAYDPDIYIYIYILHCEKPSRASNLAMAAMAATGSMQSKAGLWAPPWSIGPRGEFDVPGGGETVKRNTTGCGRFVEDLGAIWYTRGGYECYDSWPIQIDGLPGFSYWKWWFSIAMLNSQRVLY